MVRTPCRDINGLKKGTWTPEEDQKLMAYVTKYGCWNWRQLPKFAGLSRCGKSCRLRYLNYLRPNIKRGNFTKEEEDTILRLHGSLGNRWSAIAAQLPGRTDNEIKNHWHTSLKKIMQKDLVSKNKPKQKLRAHHSSGHNIKSQKQQSTAPVDNIINSAIHPQATECSSSSFSLKPCSPSDISSISNHDFAFFEPYEEPTGNFWTEPFVSDDYYMPNEFTLPCLDLLHPLLDDEILWSYSPFEQ